MTTRDALHEALGFTLSEEQWQVLEAPLSPCVVVAGAGTGKTTAMAARVAWLVVTDQVRADAVLGLTFTTKAAGELRQDVRNVRQRLAKSLEAMDRASDEVNSAEPTVLTYHAFAARIIAEHGLRLGIEPTAEVLSAGPRMQMAHRLVCSTELPLGSADVSEATITQNLVALDDSLADLAVEPAVLIEHDQGEIEWLESLPKLSSIGVELIKTSRRRKLLAQLVIEWRAEKKKRGVLDFADQTRLALELVTTYPTIRQSLRSLFGVVLLDEYQDTSVAQRKMLQQIFGTGHALTAVGDPCQALYTWRGASFETIDTFLRDFTGSADAAPSANLSLTANRRSDRAILAAANVTSKELRDKHPNVRELVPGDPDRPLGDLSCALFETVLQERAWLVERIRELGGRHDWGSIAVLGATAAVLADVAVRLEQQGIPVQVHGAAGLLHQPAVAELYSMLRAIHDPTDNVALARLLTGVRWSIGPRDLAALGSRARFLAQGVGRPKTTNVVEALDAAVAGSDPVEALALGDALSDLGDPGEYSPQALSRLTELDAELRGLRRSTGQPLSSFIARVIAATGLGVEAALDQAELGHAAALHSFLALIDEFGTTSLGAFLSLLADMERFDVDLPLESVRQRDAVQLMTIHKAKGLEFPHVFVPSVAAGVFPSGKSRAIWTTNATEVPFDLREDAPAGLPKFPRHELGSPRPTDHNAYKDALQALHKLDDRRLAYVALTRAQQSLVVTGYRWGLTQSKPFADSPYLAAVAEACTSGQGTVVTWAPMPAPDARNPMLASGPARTAWPAPVSTRQTILEAADAVTTRLQQPPTLPGMPDRPYGNDRNRLSDQERARVAAWDLDAAAFLAEARRRRERHRVVRLPDSVSASTMLRAAKEPESLALDLARPMPQRPSLAARRGIAFHTWAERRFGQQALLVPDDLPGAADAELIDVDLQALQSAFESSAFADRIPVAVEHPFALVLDGRVIRGRIDAVFERNGRYDVIDWKTGSSADPLQLAIYRTAWAREKQIPVEQVDAGFLMVRTGEVIRPEPLPDLDSMFGR